MTANDRVLLIKAKGGFGNRMLSAATGVVLASLTQREAIIDWRDGDYLAVGENAYPLLFEDPAAHPPELFDHCTDVAPAVWSGELDRHPYDLMNERFPDDHSNPFIYRRLSVDLAHPDVEPAVAVFWSYLPKMARLRRRARRSSRFRDMSSDDMTRWALQRYFRPRDRIRTAAGDVIAAHAGPVIGVHIRYTDRKVSLGRIYREVTALRARMPAATIFLATDNATVQHEFRDRFDGVFVIEKELGDDGSPLHDRVELPDRLLEAENALIDMFALSSCDWLVHSRHSTFSVAAALIGGIPKSRQRDIDRSNPRVVVKRWIQAWT
ncbi:MAG TPA: nodulation protein NodZ [Microbacterium sp.]|nr:nodulation protein NodZ [Microbacterium sp.]